MSMFEKVISNVKKRSDDDIVDRANYFYTPMMLGMFTVLLATKQYVGKPLECWLPAQFKDQWEKYAESYCFVENTYFVSFNESFPRTNDQRESRELHYYQWVPFMLAAQIILFTLPKTIWNSFNLRTGIHINSLVDKAMGSTKETKRGKSNKKIKADRHAEGKSMARKIDEVLDYNIEARLSKNLEKKPAQNYVTNLYLFFKLLNLIVCVGQLFILNHFLSPEYKVWGYGIFMDLYNNRPWQHSGHFPRVTYCDINIREQGGHMVQHTFQCVLMINMFNEKVYVFIWFWLVLLSIMDIFNLCAWFYRSINTRGDRKFVKTHLLRSNEIHKMGLKEKPCDDDIDNFIRYKLCRDGMTIMRLISSNCGSMAASFVLTPLFKKYMQDKNLEPYPQTNAQYLGKDVPEEKPPQELPNDNPLGNGNIAWVNKPAQNGYVKRNPSIVPATHPATPLNTPDAQATLDLQPHQRNEYKLRAAGLGVPMDQSIDEEQPMDNSDPPTNYIMNVVENVRETSDELGQPLDSNYPHSPILPAGI